MKKSLVLLLAFVLAASAACRKSGTAASDAPEAAASQSDQTAEEAPLSLDTESVMKTIREGDAADILEILALMTADREGWAAGDYEDLIRPLWNLFARQSSPQANDAGDEIQRRVSNLFNFGDWYPILEDLLIVASDRAAQPSVREAAAEHLWRFATKDKAGQGFSIPAADRPRIEKTVRFLLDDPGYALEATAAQTASILGMKSSVTRLKAIAGQAGVSAELRSLKFTVGEALFGLGETGAALGVMQSLAAGSGDFSEEAAEFLKKNGKK
ncbi:MAG: hypothetical protein PHI34_03110 [Acidobacteriota bacterium]|nr:hypothetical protein [Acidobacteriota bacterium]